MWFLRQQLPPTNPLVQAPTYSKVPALIDSVVSAPSFNVVCGPTYFVVSATTDSVVPAPIYSVVPATTDSVVSAPTNSAYQLPLHAMTRFVHPLCLRTTSFFQYTTLNVNCPSTDSAKTSHTRGSHILVFVRNLCHTP